MATPAQAPVASSVPPSATGSTNGVTMPRPADLESLLGAAGHGTLPLWLKPDMFLDSQFDVDVCVADLRRYAPLSTLQHELNSYLANLKSKMIEVINEDYQGYVALAGRLTNVDGAVVRMRKPLLELKDKLTVVCEAVRGELAALAAGLRRRKEVGLARGLLALLQELAQLAGKVDKLLAEVSSEDAARADPDTRTRLLERVAGEVSRLTFQATRGKDLAFVRAMEPRITAARSELLTALSTALSAALTAGDQASALHCLHAYAELGAPEPAEGTLRTAVVRPIVQRLVSEHKTSHSHRAAAAAHHLAAHPPGQAQGQPGSTTGTRDDGLAGLLAHIEQQTVAGLGQLLPAVLTPQSPLRAFDLLGNVILAETDACLGSQLPGVFSPGVPATFHTNYLAAQGFLSALEARCRGRTALDRLRTCAAWGSWAKRWNTSVYFSLIYQEVAGDLEDAAMSGRPDLPPASPLSGPPTGAPPALLPLSAALTRGLGRIASPSVFLTVLADRFLKLALQLGQRYITWAAGVCAARQAGLASAAHGSAHGHSRSGSAAGSLLGGGASEEVGSPGDHAGAYGGAAAGAGAAGEGAAGVQHAWVAALPPDDVVALYVDMAAVTAHLRDQFTPALLARLESLPGEARDAVTAGVAALADAINAQAARLLGVLGDEAAEACTLGLKGIKSISTTYRMTTKGVPTRHSHYVTTLLGPLRALLSGHRAAGLPETVKADVAGRVVDGISVKYQALAEDQIVTLRKTESSLKRLKKTVAQAEGEVTMSDSDKLILQLYLDVSEYGSQAERFGLHPRDMPSFARLLDTVTPPASVLAAVSGGPGSTAATVAHGAGGGGGGGPAGVPAGVPAVTPAATPSHHLSATSTAAATEQPASDSML